MLDNPRIDLQFVSNFYIKSSLIPSVSAQFPGKAVTMYRDESTSYKVTICQLRELIIRLHALKMTLITKSRSIILTLRGATYDKRAYVRRIVLLCMLYWCEKKTG